MKKNIYFLLLIILSLNSTTQDFIEAVRVRDIDRVNEFLARNISPLLVDNLGRSLLLMALENEDADIARTLINSHGGIHKARLLAFSDSFNNKPLHIAAKFGDLDLLNDLYYTGFDIDSQNDNDDTPLHIASRNGNLEAVRFFIEKGANFDITNQSDYTPLDSARRHQGVESDVYNYLNNLLQSDGLSSIGSVETDDDFIGEYNSDITDLEDFNLFVTRELTHHNLDVVENLPNLIEMFNTVLDGRGYVTRAEIMGWVDSLNQTVQAEEDSQPDDDQVAILYGTTMPHIATRETARKSSGLRLSDGSKSEKTVTSLSEAFSDWSGRGYSAENFNKLLAEGDKIYSPSEDEVEEVMVPQGDALDYLRLQVKDFDDLILSKKQLDILTKDYIKGSELANLVNELN